MTLADVTTGLVKSKRILKSFLRVFAGGRSFSNASALAYTSLLSFVPLMAVSLSIFSAFPVFENVSAQMQDFVFENFVPTSGKVVQEYILEFSSKAKQLTGVGIFFLIVTAIMLMSTIEKAFNSIWQVSESRTLRERFVVYWSALTVGPLLMGVAIAITSYIVSIPLVEETATLIGRRFGFLKLIPFSIETIAFLLLYTIVPNTKIAFRDALPGSTIAAILFEAAKSGFAWYITRFPTYETIYGALSVIRIFLIWVYVSWIVALIGAEITHFILRVRTSSGLLSSGELPNDFLSAYHILGHLYQSQGEGRPVELEQLASSHPKYGAQNIEQTLVKLQESQLVARNEHGDWFLTRDLARYTLLDLYRSQSYTLPTQVSDEITPDSANQGFQPVLNKLQKTIDEVMAVPISSLFEAHSGAAAQFLPLPEK